MPRRARKMHQLRTSVAFRCWDSCFHTSRFSGLRNLQRDLKAKTTDICETNHESFLMEWFQITATACVDATTYNPGQTQRLA